jgi:hypothetical protein
MGDTLRYAKGYFVVVAWMAPPQNEQNAKINVSRIAQIQGEKW